MLSTRILGRLLIITGGIIGLAFLTYGQMTDTGELGRWGIAALCVTCTYSLHQRLTLRDCRLAEAFRLGQMDERARHQADQEPTPWGSGRKNLSSVN